MIDKSDSKSFVIKEACDLIINWTRLMGYISKQIYFCSRITINENINTAVYTMLLQQIDVCLRRSEKNLTNAL